MGEREHLHGDKHAEHLDHEKHVEAEKSHSTKFVGGAAPGVNAGGGSTKPSASERAYGKKDRETLITTVASQLHETWRAPRLDKATGKYEPRVKNTKDAKWSASHGGKADVDIANTSYKDLPSDWQAENQASAQVAVDFLMKNSGPYDASFIERASDEIHVQWLERNKGWAQPDQKLPYSKLSDSEKEKDRVVIRTAIQAFK